LPEYFLRNPEKILKLFRAANEINPRSIILMVPSEVEAGLLTLGPVRDIFKEDHLSYHEES